MNKWRRGLLLGVAGASVGAIGWGDKLPALLAPLAMPGVAQAKPVQSKATITSPQLLGLIRAAKAQQGQVKLYDPAYRTLAFPGGDVPPERGVCTDVIIRSYRGIGIDLQALVNADMRAHFARYPQRWGLTKTDAHIDHRRVPNLQTFFSRHGQTLPLTRVGADYQPGDIVTWALPGGLPHIGLVTDEPVAGTDRYQIAHHIGGPMTVEDMLFAYVITGHYRYHPWSIKR